jgi:hypothetical protein
VTDLIPEELRETAHKEYEIAKLLGPSDEYEQAWLDYCDALVTLTDAYLAKVAS